MIEADRLISAGATIAEDVADRAIRPKLLAEYVGQPQVRSPDGDLYSGGKNGVATH
ncbi:Holliday junction DNA helicase [Salmonella sp. NCTC 11881]|nr:Holliday junction DNA helicase [Salmonella sp. NCTC 11881]